MTASRQNDARGALVLSAESHIGIFFNKTADILMGRITLKDMTQKFRNPANKQYALWAGHVSAICDVKCCAVAPRTSVVRL